MFASELTKRFCDIQRFVDGGSEEISGNDLRVFMEEYFKAAFAKQHRDYGLGALKLSPRIDKLEELGCIDLKVKNSLHTYRNMFNSESHTFSSMNIESKRAEARQFIQFIFDNIRMNDGN